METRKSRWGLWLFVLILGGVLLFSLYTWLSLSWSYSTGERTGYVQKFSRKGYVFKTWEGELTMVAIPGSMPEKFFFTVREDAVAGQINQAMGKRVVLRYRQHIGIPVSWFGETGYFVFEAKAVE
jgi:hypothetical protein